MNIMRRSELCFGHVAVILLSQQSCKAVKGEEGGEQIAYGLRMHGSNCNQRLIVGSLLGQCCDTKPYGSAPGRAMLRMP